MKLVHWGPEGLEYQEPRTEAPHLIIRATCLKPTSAIYQAHLMRSYNCAGDKSPDARDPFAHVGFNLLKYYLEKIIMFEFGSNQHF